jgi:hypothetical protein
MSEKKKNSCRRPKIGQIKKSYFTCTPLLVMPYNFCSVKFSVKCMVWPGEVFQHKEVSLGQIFFKHAQKPFIGQARPSTVPNFIEIGPMVWISVADIHTLIR